MSRLLIARSLCTSALSYTLYFYINIIYEEFYSANISLQAYFAYLSGFGAIL